MGDALAGFLFTLLFPNSRRRLRGVFPFFDDFDVAGHLSDLADQTCCAGRLRAGGGRHRRIVTRTAGAMQAAHAGRARLERTPAARGGRAGPQEMFKRCMYIDHCNHVHVYTDPDRRRSVWVLAPALSLSSRPGLMPGLWKVCGPLYCTSTVQRLGTGADARST